MDQQQRKAMVQKTFDTVAEGYGTAGMRFFHHAAAQLPEILSLKGDEHLLDVATGTGIAAATIASHLPQGKVTGIDFSQGMLAQARANAQAKQLHNMEFHFMDMQQIDFPDAHFDAANCSFGLFFLPDMKALLEHIASKVKPGGQVAASSFYHDAFTPNVDLFLERIQSYGITPPDFSWKNISTEVQFLSLYERSGLKEIAVYHRDVGYFLKDAEEWWSVIWYAGFRGLVAQLDEEKLERFRQEHLEEIAALATPQGIPLNVKVLFGTGRAGC
jgi:ubiquinone/menaquinone biosynthesis C-methylase UbiE